MDVEKLNLDFVALAEKINDLDDLDYSDERYDDLEEELHNMEDSFLEEFGKELEEAVALVHDEFCPDTDVLLPTAYFAKNYLKLQRDNKGNQVYDVEFGEGVPVEVDDFPEQDVHLVLVPGPTRLLVTVGDSAKQVAWKAK